MQCLPLYKKKYLIILYFLDNVGEENMHENMCFFLFYQKPISFHKLFLIILYFLDQYIQHFLFNELIESVKLAEKSVTKS